MSSLPEPLNCFVQERGAVTAPLSPVDHEQRPNVTRLMVRAEEALNPRIVLGNKENRLVQIPLDFRWRDERGIVKPIFSGSMPHLGNARQVELRGWAQAGEHLAIRLPGAMRLIQRRPAFCSKRELQAAPRVSNVANAIASRGARLAHSTNWNAW